MTFVGLVGVVVIGWVYGWPAGVLTGLVAACVWAPMAVRADRAERLAEYLGKGRDDVRSGRRLARTVRRSMR